MAKKAKPKIAVQRMGIGRFRAIMAQVFREGRPVILADRGSPRADPRAIVLVVSKFNRCQIPLGGFGKAMRKLRSDLAAAIDEIGREL